MKRIVLALVAMTLLAAPAFAIQVGQLPPNDQGGSNNLQPGDTPVGHNQPGDLPDGDDNPTRPVPEPGTMALAAMSAMAIGAAVRKRRNRNNQ